MKRLFLLYLLLILYVSLYPWRFTPIGVPPARVLTGWYPAIMRSDYADLLANLLFYVPLGTLGVLAWGGAAAPWRQRAALVAGGTALSLAMELAQAWIPGRISSLRDLAMNASGTIAGVGLGALFSRYLPAHAHRGIVRVGRRMPLVLASAWLVAQCFPFLPITRLSPLRGSLMQLVRLSSVSWLALAETFVSCLLLSRLLRDSRAQMHRHTLVLAAFLVFPLRVFLQGGALSWAHVATAAAAFLLSVCVLSRLRGEIRWLAGLALLLVAAKEFAPFALTGTPSPFNFTPFAAFLESNRDSAIRITAGKLFLYGTSVWMLREAKLPLWSAAGLVMLLLTAGEATQRYLPGRTPESTDPLLALLAALLMVWLSNHRTAG